MDKILHDLIRTLNYGNYGIFLIIWVMQDFVHQQYEFLTIETLLLRILYRYLIKLWTLWARDPKSEGQLTPKP